MKYAIEFQTDYGDGPVAEYAGMHKGALGWAPTLETAIIWVDREAAERTLQNGYGALGEQGRVIEVPE